MEWLLIFLSLLAFVMFGTSLSDVGRDIAKSLLGRNATLASGLIAFGLAFVTLTLLAPKWLCLLSGVVTIVVGIILLLLFPDESISRSLPAPRHSENANQEPFLPVQIEYTPLGPLCARCHQPIESAPSALLFSVDEGGVGHPVGACCRKAGELLRPR